MSSASASSASESAASASASSASVLSSGGINGGTDSGSNPRSTNGGSNLQNGDGSSSFPHWAIAVITILGFFALIAFVMLVFLVVHRVRRDRDRQNSRRGSMGSQSPMMQSVQQGIVNEPQSPPPTLVGVGAVGGGAFAGSDKGRASTVINDGASTHSDTPFSGADAAVMAEAFRKALRKPDFADRPVEEGDSPDQPPDDHQPQLINRELAEEGRDIRSVSSSRGVRVETLPDERDGDSPTEHDSML